MYKLNQGFPHSAMFARYQTASERASESSVYVLVESYDSTLYRSVRVLYM